MGHAKKEMMRIEELEGPAREALLKAGALASCDLHEDELLQTGDDEALKKAYAIGTNMLKRGEIDGTREEFMQAIKDASDNAAEECYQCAKYLRD